MSERLQQLTLKKQRLLARSTDLRERLIEQSAGFSPAFSFADLLHDGIAMLRRHPEWVVGAAAFVLVARPRFVWRWAKRGLVGWRLWHTVQDLLARSAAPRPRAD